MTPAPTFVPSPIDVSPRYVRWFAFTPFWSTAFFVSTKKAVLAKGVKANHLTYLGDTSIGEGTNVGAGVITCNYDGFTKHRTTIGKDVFVGSDTQLIAPVTVGDGAVIAAGTTVTMDVPEGALTLSRAPQKNVAK